MASRKQDLDGALCLIKQKAPKFKPKIGIILGSGLGPLADHIKDPIEFTYEDLPGFPVSSVRGHHGLLILGKIGGVPVVCLKGRVHLYEGTEFGRIKTLVRVLKLLGCHTLIATNAAGSLRREVKPGDIAVINDHINFMGFHPLVGPNDEEFGPRFVNMSNAYDEDLRKKLHQTGLEANIAVHDANYLAVIGPTFETHAEIHAFRTLGATTVGMSIVPETILARHCDMKVLAMSAITNLAAGLSDIPLSHKQTLEGAKLAEKNLCRLVELFLTKHAHEF